MKNIAIKENHLYNKTFKRGKSFVGRYVAVYVLKDLSAERLKKENPQKKSVNRIGLSVSKKIGGAVQRNRAKRIIRAGLDGCKNELKQGFLIVISARTAIVDRTSIDIEKEIRYSFSKLDMFMRNDSTAQKEEKKKKES